MTMNLNELYSHRVYITSNKDKKVISKELCLSILDSHISLLQSLDESKVIQESTEPVRVAQELVRMPKLDHHAHAEKVRKVYEDATKWTGS